MEIKALELVCFNSQEEAVRAASEAADKMPRNKGWTAQVWCNLTWRYKLTNGPITVFQSNNGKWGALCGETLDQEGVHIGPWTTQEGHDTPGKAAMFEAEALRDFVQYHIEILNAAVTSVEGLEEYETPEKTTMDFGQRN